MRKDFCPTCHRALDAGQEVCPECGPLDWDPVCPNCKKVLNPKKRYCPTCGADSRPKMPKPLTEGCAIVWLIVVVIFIGLGATCAFQQGGSNGVDTIVHFFGWMSLALGAFFLFFLILAWRGRGN
jgi:RNA polymerase subunit RPABC4/transcription elongation factor Spt4